MSLLLRWLVNAAALYVAAELIPGIVVESTGALLLAAIVIGLVNTLVKPVVVLLTLPVTIVTLGLFYLVVNGAMLALAAALTPGFALAGFGSAVLGAVVVSLVGMALNAIVREGTRA